MRTSKITLHCYLSSAVRKELFRLFIEHRLFARCLVKTEQCRTSEKIKYLK